MSQRPRNRRLQELSKPSAFRTQLTNSCRRRLLDEAARHGCTLVGAPWWAKLKDRGLHTGGRVTPGGGPQNTQRCRIDACTARESRQRRPGVLAATHPARGMAGRSPRPAALPVAGRCRGVLPDGQTMKAKEAKIAAASIGLKHQARCGPDQRQSQRSYHSRCAYTTNMGSKTPGAMPEAGGAAPQHAHRRVDDRHEGPNTTPAHCRAGTIAALRPTPVTRRGTNCRAQSRGNRMPPMPPA